MALDWIFTQSITLTVLFKRKLKNGKKLFSRFQQFKPSPVLAPPPGSGKPAAAAAGQQQRRRQQQRRDAHRRRGDAQKPFNVTGWKIILNYFKTRILTVLVFFSNIQGRRCYACPQFPLKILASHHKTRCS